MLIQVELVIGATVRVWYFFTLLFYTQATPMPAVCNYTQTWMYSNTLHPKLEKL
jgi:hypothetical protein